MVSWQADSRALAVLSRALHSTSRVTRSRAVAMLAHVSCPQRTSWLEEALSDADSSVAAIALLVLSWVSEVDEPPWPQREDPSFDGAAAASTEDPNGPAAVSSRWQWEYVVEVWRDDGLLLGSYLVATCAEDDEHARRIALGQAILANAGGRGDPFDALTAASFIVDKRQLAGGGHVPGRRGRRGGLGRAV